MENIKQLVLRMTTHETDLAQQHIQSQRENKEVFQALEKMKKNPSRENTKHYIREMIHLHRSNLKELFIFCENNDFDLEKEVLEDDSDIMKRGYFNTVNKPKHAGCDECKRKVDCVLYCKLTEEERLAGCFRQFERVVPHD